MVRDYVPLVNVLGKIFQIRDDYLNLQSDVYVKNKGFGEDLTEGKFSFPIIHSIRSNPANIQILNILRQRTEDEDVKRFAIQYIESTGSFSYCRERLADLTAEAREIVQGMGGKTKHVDKLVEMLGLKI